MKKVFVVTAYSGENEFEKCQESVKRQIGVTSTHYIVKNKPILEAFENLYQTWEGVKDNYDFLVQLDADMVIDRDDVFRYIGQLFDSHKKPNMVIFPVRDFFTDSNIWGLQCYTKDIKFNNLTNKYKPDHEYDKSNRKKIEIPINSRAFVSHGFMPTIRTAFHFGWHRKLRSTIKPGLKRSLQLVHQAYRATNDPMRGHAVAGSLYAERYMKSFSGDISPIEYTSSIFTEQLEKYEETLKDV
jgi:hypothetical protein